MGNSKKIFFLGIKGVAMTGLAIIFKKLGYKVYGSDIKGSFITNNILKKHKINCYNSFNPKYILKNIDFFVYSAAHKGSNNPQALKAKKLNIKIYNQAELIGELLNRFKNTVAVTGSHGKTTTSSTLAFLLLKLNQKISYLIGSSGFNNYPGGDYLGDDYFVFEADEYAVNPPQNKKIKLNYYRPDSIIITNIDFDHPDVYSDINDSKKKFELFLRRTKKIYYCIDNSILRKIIDQNKIIENLSFGYSNNADLKISNLEINEQGSEFRLEIKGKKLGSFKTQLFGEKIVSNIAGCILFLLDQGFKIEKIRENLKLFTGPKRRFEKIFELNNIKLYDDYAHHPSEIETVIKTCKTIFNRKRIIILFHPHTYSRTKYFLTEFAQSLSKADYSIILPIFSSAREKVEEFNITSYDIEKESKKFSKNIIAVESSKEALKEISKILKKNDVILTMGAGDVYLLHNNIIDLIKNIK